MVNCPYNAILPRDASVAHAVTAVISAHTPGLTSILSYLQINHVLAACASAVWLRRSCAVADHAQAHALLHSLCHSCASNKQTVVAVSNRGITPAFTGSDWLSYHAKYDVSCLAPEPMHVSLFWQWRLLHHQVVHGTRSCSG